MRGSTKLLVATIVCVASARGIDLIDGILTGLSIGNRDKDNDEDSFKGMDGLIAISPNATSLYLLTLTFYGRCKYATPSLSAYTKMR